MCGRFGLGTPEFSETRFGARALPELQPELLIPRFNIAPTQPVLTVVCSKRLDGARGLKGMTWGLTPLWAANDRSKPRPINIQSETLPDRPAYRRLLERKRCLIPSDGFYEWKRNGSARQPYHIGLADGAIFAFAGVWDAVKMGPEWLVSCAILTTRPNDLVSDLHNRQPVILRPQDEELWLSDCADARELTPLLEPLPAEEMTIYAVVPLVNNVANEGPELRQPAEAAPSQPVLL
ncbi:MAG TPA: SOS response-associated peptidase [Chloroflexota bacterium]|nr:SOS response-associated peptidase [Chloroflexota bacterium]